MTILNQQIDTTSHQSVNARSGFVRGIIYILEEWRALTIVFERTFTSNMAATVPWIAPLIPASFALKNAADKLHVQNGVEYIIAASIEGLGMSVTSTAFELWDWNDKNKDAKLSAPIRISIGTVVFYVVIVISVNVGLDLNWADWLIKAMLSLLSIPAVVTLALRSQHSRRVADQEAAKAEADQQNIIAQEAQTRAGELAAEMQRKQMEFDLEQKRLDAETRRKIKIEKAKVQPEKVSGNFPSQVETFPKVSESSDQWRTLKKKLSDAQLYAILRQPISELARQYGKTEKAVEKWALYAAEEIRARGLVVETAQE